MLSQPKAKKSEETSAESTMFKFGPLRGRPEFWYEHVPLCQEDPNCFRSACGYSHPERDSRSARWTWVYPTDWYQAHKVSQAPQGDKRNISVQQPGYKLFGRDGVTQQKEAQPSSNEDVSSPRAYNPWAFNNTDLRKGFGSGSLKSKSLRSASSIAPEGAKIVEASDEEVRVPSTDNLAVKPIKSKIEEAESAKSKNRIDELVKKQEVGKEKFRARSKEVRRPPGFLQLDNSKHRVEEIQSPTSGLAFTLKGGSSDSKTARKLQPRSTHATKTLSVSSSIFPKQSSSSQSLDMHAGAPKSHERSAKLSLLWTLICAWLLAFGDGLREAFLSASASVSVLYHNLPVLGKKQRFVSVQASKPVIYKAKSDITVSRKSQT